MNSYFPRYRDAADEHGPIKISVRALWGARTERGLSQQMVPDPSLPRRVWMVLGIMKEAAALANHQAGRIDFARARAIQNASLRIAAGQFDAHLPVTIWQTRDGVLIDENVAEVIANLASTDSGLDINADLVNLGQPSAQSIELLTSILFTLELDVELIPLLGEMHRRFEEELFALPQTYLLEHAQGELNYISRVLHKLPFDPPADDEAERFLKFWTTELRDRFGVDWLYDPEHSRPAASVVPDLVKTLKNLARDYLATVRLLSETTLECRHTPSRTVSWRPFLDSLAMLEAKLAGSAITLRQATQDTPLLPLVIVELYQSVELALGATQGMNERLKCAHGTLLKVPGIEAPRFPQAVPK